MGEGLEMHLSVQKRFVRRSHDERISAVVNYRVPHNCKGFVRSRSRCLAYGSFVSRARARKKMRLIKIVWRRAAPLNVCIGRAPDSLPKSFACSIGAQSMLGRERTARSCGLPHFPLTPGLVFRSDQVIDGRKVQQSKKADLKWPNSRLESARFGLHFAAPRRAIPE